VDTSDQKPLKMTNLVGLMSKNYHEINRRKSELTFVDLESDTFNQN